MTRYDLDDLRQEMQLAQLRGQKSSQIDHERLDKLLAAALREIRFDEDGTREESFNCGLVEGLSDAIVTVKGVPSSVVDTDYISRQELLSDLEEALSDARAESKRKKR